MHPVIILLLLHIKTNGVEMKVKTTVIGNVIRFISSSLVLINRDEEPDYDFRFLFLSLTSILVVVSPIFSNPYEGKVVSMKWTMKMWIIWRRPHSTSLLHSFFLFLLFNSLNITPYYSIPHRNLFWWCHPVSHPSAYILRFPVLSSASTSCCITSPVGCIFHNNVWSASHF